MKNEQLLKAVSMATKMYCLRTAENEIYGMTRHQLEELRRTLGRFIEREKAPFACSLKSYGAPNVRISKNVTLYAGEQRFVVGYSLSSDETDSISATQMEEVMDLVRGFLRRFGENGDRQLTWDIAYCPEEGGQKLRFTIRPDDRRARFEASPCVSKSIIQENTDETTISYSVDVNEMRTENLSLSEFVGLYQLLGNFLNGEE